MKHCAQCGHALGIGRFCLNCGHPVDAPLGPVEPVEPVEPPFSPEATQPRPVTTQVVPPRSSPYHRGRRAWIGWLAGFAVLAVTAAFGIGLATGDDQASAPSGGETSAAPIIPSPTLPTESPSPTDEGPTESPSESSGEEAESEDLARLASARVPATAPPNQDLDGNMVRYEARNMLDGVSTTCWRMPGDGSGDEIVFDLGEPVTLTSVGLINGYAKSAQDSSGRRLDWYAGNRRVLVVEWIFDDGTTLTQDLRTTRKLQQIDLDTVTTSLVRLRLVEVSAPGSGRASRNYTAISDVALVGTPS